jgi:hypothetical protein
MPVYPARYGFRDARGYLAYLSLWIYGPDAETAADDAFDLADYLYPLTNCNYQSTGGINFRPASAFQYGGVGLYQSVADKATLVFADPLGQPHRYRLPAPTVGMFLADGETVDPAQFQVAALIAAFTTDHVCARNGARPLAYLGGYRQRAPARRRMGAVIRNPSLNGPI